VGKITDPIHDDLAQRTLAALSLNGSLSQKIPGFVPRQAQITLANAVTQTIENAGTLVAEAGTGTGKTFAYLIPSLLSGKKILLSTATKTLQDQLFSKDIPELIRVLGLTTRIQNMKGRANYICLHRTHHYAEEGHFPLAQTAHDIANVREKIPKLKSGERTELPEITEDSSAWPYVTSNADNCLGTDCAYQSDCFLLKTRRRAMKADLVIINHHLFFADAKLKDRGFGELLPSADVVIFDEAHQLLDIATHFYGEQLSTRQLKIAIDETLETWPVIDLVDQPLKNYALDLENHINDLRHHVMTLSEEKILWHKALRVPAFKAAWQALDEWFTQCLHCFESQDLTEQPKLLFCKNQLESLQQIYQAFNHPSPHSKMHIHWIERFKHHLAFHITPLDIASIFSTLRAATPAAFIFTSATLSTAETFDCFTQGLGLVDPQTLIVESPFNYKQQALLYLPRSMPDPQSVDYYRCLVEQALPIIKAYEGKCFFLFTSHRGLQAAANILRHQCHYPLLIQGDESKSILLERFRTLGNAVLLGTATFWEGVDVKGETLSCVLIDKLPFENPHDPVVQGKMAYFKAQGLSAFDVWSLPQTILALKQGAGRLIRDITDRGVLMIADPRLTGRAYGERIFKSLPPMPKTRNLTQVLSFITESST